MNTLMGQVNGRNTPVVWFSTKDYRCGQNVSFSVIRVKKDNEWLWFHNSCATKDVSNTLLEVPAVCKINMTNSSPKWTEFEHKGYQHSLPTVCNKAHITIFQKTSVRFLTTSQPIINLLPWRHIREQIWRPRSMHEKDLPRMSHSKVRDDEYAECFRKDMITYITSMKALHMLKIHLKWFY